MPDFWIQGQNANLSIAHSYTIEHSLSYYTHILHDKKDFVFFQLLIVHAVDIYHLHKFLTLRL